jgi:MmgE/PrpD C-terminal domain
MHVEIEIELDDGTMIRRRCDAPLGSWSRPVPDDRVIEKARALIVGVLGASKATAIERAIAATADFPVRPLMAVLA